MSFQIIICYYTLFWRIEYVTKIFCHRLSEFFSLNSKPVLLFLNQICSIYMYIIHQCYVQFDIGSFHTSFFMYIYLNVDKHSLGPAKLSCPARPPRRLVVSFMSAQMYIHIYICMQLSLF